MENFYLFMKWTVSVELASYTCDFWTYLNSALLQVECLLNELGITLDLRPLAAYFPLKVDNF